MDAPYAPYYCEENVWQRAVLSPTGGFAVLIAGRLTHIPFWCQRLGEPVMWDYHAVFLHPGETWLVSDPDSRLPLPVPLGRYLDVTFRESVPAPSQPRFRLIPAAVYRDTFYSDRSHMRDPAGGWLAPPPPWPAIRPEQGCCIRELADMSRPEPGRIFDLAGLKRFSGYV